MFSELNMGWFPGLLLVCLPALVVYFVLYPLKIIALFSPLFKPEKKSLEDILAVPVKTKIKIEFNGDPEEKSKLIYDMKSLLENLAAENGDIYAIQSVTTDIPKGPEEQLENPIIPEDDEENPDLRIDEKEGPEVREDQALEDKTEEPSDTISFKDLLSKS